MPTYSDNLDGTSGDLLRSRSGWSRTLGTDDVVITTAGSGVTLTDGATAANGTWHVPTSQPSGNDQFAEGLLKTGIAGGQRPLCVRANVASALGVTYSARRNTSNQVLIHRRSAAGAFTQLGSYTVTPSTDFDTKKVRLEAVGNQITLYFGGTAVIGPVTDNNITSGSVAILTVGGSYTSTNNVLDDYAWGDVGDTGLTGTVTGTLGALTTTSQANLDILGSVIRALQPITTSAQAKVFLKASVANTLQALTTDAEGVLTTLGLTGSLTKTLAALTASGQADTYLQAALARTLQALTASAQAKVYLRAALTRTLQALTVSSTSTGGIEATLSGTLQALTSSSSALVFLQASLVRSLQSLTASATGVLTTNGLTGSLNRTLQPLLSSSNAKLFIRAASSSGFSALYLEALGRLKIKAIMASTLAALTAGIIGRWPNAIQPASSRTIILEALKSNILVLPERKSNVIVMPFSN